MTEEVSTSTIQPSAHGYLMLLVGDERATSDAALGIALRGAGHNLRVHIIEFQKTGRDRGEVKQTASEIGSPGTSPERTESAVKDARLHVNRRVTNILVLEGILTLVDQGLVNESSILELVNNAAPWLDIVATGTSATDALKDAADSITTMETTKAESNGSELRPGIHY